MRVGLAKLQDDSFPPPPVAPSSRTQNSKCSSSCIHAYIFLLPIFYALHGRRSCWDCTFSCSHTSCSPWADAIRWDICLESLHSLSTSTNFSHVVSCPGGERVCVFIKDGGQQQWYCNDQCKSNSYAVADKIAYHCMYISAANVLEIRVTYPSGSYVIDCH